LFSKNRHDDEQMGNSEKTINATNIMDLTDIVAFFKDIHSYDYGQVL